MGGGGLGSWFTLYGNWCFSPVEIEYLKILPSVFSNFTGSSGVFFYIFLWCSLLIWPRLKVSFPVLIFTSLVGDLSR